MPIVVNLDVMMAKRKISLTELSNRLDMSIVSLSILKSGKAKAVKIDTLDVLCKVLECQPGDILQYLNEEDYGKLMNF